MVEATDIEKKSLEAHVELCAERYNKLEDKLETLDDNITHVCAMITDVKRALSELTEKSNDRLINWGIGIIGFLVASILGLIIHNFK